MPPSSGAPLGLSFRRADATSDAAMPMNTATVIQNPSNVVSPIVMMQ